jgi:CRISPR-associated protein Cas2
MLVVLANHVPPAVRGRMKLWFVEPRPNLFVSGIRDSTADRVVDYLFEHCSLSSGLMVFQRH